MTVLIKIIQVIISLGLLIILHEGGHFLFAKLFKTRVNKFYLFFDYKFHLFSTYDNWFRRLFGKKPVPKKDDGEYEYQGTEYGIGWIPLGGYVAIDGMIDETQSKEKLKAEPQPWEFRTKPAWQRLLIMLGGVLMNFLVAFFIYAMVLFAWGKEYVKTTDMTYGMKFSEVAKQDGFRDGDLILGVDDQTFDDWNVNHIRDLSNANVAHVQRDGKQLDVQLSGAMNLLDMLEQPRYVDVLVPLCIDSIVPGSPAEKAHLQRGDRITSINGLPIADFNDVQNTLAALSAGISEESTHADSLAPVPSTLHCRTRQRAGRSAAQPRLHLWFVNKTPDYK